MGRLSAVLILRLLLCLSLCGLPLAAQDDAASQQQTYPVRGSVINKFTGQPIARALVTVQGQASDAVFTDSDGHFEFSHVAAGSCFLTAMRPGFSGATQFGQQEMQRIQVGPNLSDVAIALLPAGAITGQITLSTSDSAENIQVHLLRKEIQNGRAFWQQIQNRTTNNEGIYFFGNLEPGAYRVFTSGSADPEPDPMGNQPRWGFPPAYFPDSAGSTGDASLNLQHGQHVQADMLLTHEPFYSVTISVANGMRDASVQVYDLAGHPMPYPSRYNPRDQAVHVSLPKGTYQLEGSTFGETPLFGSGQITVQGAPLNVSLILLPLHAIPVNIHRQFSGQTQQATLGFMSGGGNQPEWLSAGVNLNLHRDRSGISGFAGGNLRHARNSTDASAYVLENIRPGTYWVQANSFQGYVASLSSGGVDLTQQSLVVGPGGSSSPIDVVLRDDGGTLSVSLHQATPSTGNTQPAAFLSLIPEAAVASQLPQNIRMTQSTMQIPNLPPGSYRVIAFDAPQQLEYGNPEAAKALAGKGQTVTLAPGGSTQVTLDITPTESRSQ